MWYPNYKNNANSTEFWNLQPQYQLFWSHKKKSLEIYTITLTNICSTEDIQSWGFELQSIQWRWVSSDWLPHDSICLDSLEIIMIGSFCVVHISFLFECFKHTYISFPLHSWFKLTFNSLIMFRWSELRSWRAVICPSWKISIIHNSEADNWPSALCLGCTLQLH